MAHVMGYERREPFWCRMFGHAYPLTMKGILVDGRCVRCGKTNPAIAAYAHPHKKETR